MRAILLAGAAATPDAVIWLLASNNAGNRTWSDWLLMALAATLVCFIGSVIAVTVLGLPLAWALRRIRRTTPAMYVLAGASAPLVLFGLYTFYQWNWVDSGPFTLSLRDQVDIEGARQVIVRSLFTAGSLALSGALAAYVYAMQLTHAGIQRASARSNVSQ